MNLRSAKCTEFYGINTNDDLSAADIAYIPKKSIGNFVLAPMLKSNAEALKLAFDNHDLRQTLQQQQQQVWLEKWWDPSKTNSL